MTELNQQLLDDVVEFANSIDFSDLIEEEDIHKKEHKPLTPEELKRLQKKEELYKLLKFLEEVNTTLDKYNDKSYTFKSIHETQDCNTFLTYNGARLYSLLDIEIYHNFSMMIKDENFIKEIRDKKFQSYVSARKKLDTLRKKIICIPECDYLISQILKINCKLDKYISTYLISLLINANKEFIVNYCKDEYRKKSHKRKKTIGHGSNSRPYGGL